MTLKKKTWNDNFGMIILEQMSQKEDQYKMKIHGPKGIRFSAI